MVNAELSYNPYLIETEVRFNKNEPRINSLVEKYMKSRLQSWIEYVPNIYHDEMNGYDFELMFSGTELEYNELVKSFLEAGVDHDDVRIFHINKLESRRDKVKRVEELLNWLQSYNNRRFNYEDFFEKNKELIVNSYHYVVLHTELQETPALEERDIKIENIMDISELDNTTLTNTPILFYVNSDTYSRLQIILKQLLSRHDFEKRQLFFLVDNSLNLGVVERTIIDLGVADPQIVKSVDNEIILKYFDVYPISEYIYEMIKEFNRECNQITEILNEEDELFVDENKKTRENINRLDNEIQSLKDAISSFERRDELILQDTYQYLIDYFNYKLYKWRSRKTKSHVYDEASYYAKELSDNVNEWMNDFVKYLKRHEDTLVNEIYQEYISWYVSGNQEKHYQTSASLKQCEDTHLVKDNIQDELMKLQEEDWIYPDKGLLGNLFYIPEETDEKVLQYTWRMTTWRKYVEEYTTPIMSKLIVDSCIRVKEYADDLAHDYSHKLTAMLEVKNNEKDQLTSQLSADEQMLEQDREWLTIFKDQVNKIGRE